MNEAMLVLLAGTVAMFMVTLVKADFSPDLRAAIRTTIVVLLGWGIACIYRAQFEQLSGATASESDIQKDLDVLKKWPG